MENLKSWNRSLGVNFLENGEVSIRVWAPYAKTVSIDIIGKEKVPLTKSTGGYWDANYPNAQPGDRYVFVLNEKDRFPDPASLSQPDGVHRASEFTDLSALRLVRSQIPFRFDFKDLIIYELHVGTFTPEGTFDGVIEKLDYLRDLGVNAIELMPVAAFPGERNWGYDGVYPYAVQQSYGGATGLANLVNVCHDKGIAVILDVVYNHLGPEGNYLNAYGPYFTGKYKTPWGKTFNFDGYGCEAVRQFFLENAMMWFYDFQIDGLRLDAVHAIKDQSSLHFLAELHQHVNQLNQQTGSNHFLIAENDHYDKRLISTPAKGGFGIDAHWCDDFHHSLHALLTEERDGYYADYGRLDHLVKSFNNGWIYSNDQSPEKKKITGISTRSFPGYKFVVFTQNHDQVGNRLYGERLSTLLDFESLKLATSIMLFSPFIPMLFMGEEYGEKNPFLYFTSHSEKELCEKVRKGRMKEFYFHKKDLELPDPQSPETFSKSVLSWDFSSRKQNTQLLAFYMMCIELRKNISLLQPGKRKRINARKTKNGEGIIFTRQLNREILLSVMNFSDKPLEVSLNEFQNSSLKLHLYSAHKQWSGPIENNINPLTDKKGGLLQIELNPASVLLYTGSFSD